MSFTKKPPVSSSIGIEIKAPQGVEFDGDFNVQPKMVEELIETPVKVTVFFDDDTTYVSRTEDFDETRELVREWCTFGCSKVETGRKYIHYPAHRIRKIEVEFEKL